MYRQLTSAPIRSPVYPPGVFSRCSLELTLRLLNEHNPMLAVELHRALRRHFAAAKNAFNNGDCLKAELLETLDPKAIGGIITTLTRLGQKALANTAEHPDKSTLLHGLMHDWLELAEWLLQYSTHSNSFH